MLYRRWREDKAVIYTARVIHTAVANTLRTAFAMATHIPIIATMHLVFQTVVVQLIPTGSVCRGKRDKIACLR